MSAPNGDAPRREAAPSAEAPGETPATESVRGSVVRVTYSNPETGYAVIRLRPEGDVPWAYRQAEGLVTLVGAMPGLEVGEEIEAGGGWVRDSKYGPQFKVDWFKPQLPSTERGMQAYLASGALRGVGAVWAERIVKHFGPRTFEVLEAEPERLREIPGLGPKKVADIRNAWREARGDRELVVFLGEHGVSPRVAARLSKVYGERALATVRQNPYRLAREVRGIGFHRADQIARKIGLPEDAPERLDAALMHVLDDQAGEGHTCLPREGLIETVHGLIDQPEDDIAGRLDHMLGAGVLVREVFREREAVFLAPLHDAERRIAERIRKLTGAQRRTPRIDAVGALADFEQRARIDLARQQREAALTMAREGLLILTGGPGTGKTTTVRAILTLYQEGRRSVKLAAPTGRAARRLTETAKVQAETIHRLLGFQAHTGTFARDGANPVEADLVIVDEVSMLDAPLAGALLEALRPGTCLLLVGDEDQLPSVGPGQVLGDLIGACALPTVRLTEIFRQAGASQIVVNAHRVNKGQMPWLQPPDDQTEADFFFIEREEPGEIVEAIRRLVAERIPGRFGMDARRDVQVLTPMRRGELGVNELNRVMKEVLNPGAGQTTLGGEGGVERRVQLSSGDRVMQSANNYEKGVFNGDIGRVSHADPASGEIIVDFDGQSVSYLADETDQLVLAYAVTIHKSQGSEYPAVVMPLHTQHWIMLQRNLIYTAMTRARRLVCMVGTRRALGRAVRNATRAHRFTGLKYFLGGDAGSGDPDG